MSERLRWWSTPVAVLVLLRIVTLPSAPPAAPATVASRLPAVALCEASGRRSETLALGGADAFIMSLPPGLAGQTGTMTLWRRRATRDAVPWLSVPVRARADATIPFAGLAAGRYDLELRFGATAAPVEFFAADVAVPGQVDFARPAPPATAR